MRKTVDNYNAEQCCVALHSLREKKAYTRKKLDVLTDSQVMIRALQLQLARDIDDRSTQNYDLTKNEEPAPRVKLGFADAVSNSLKSDRQPNCSKSKPEHSLPPTAKYRQKISRFPDKEEREVLNFLLHSESDKDLVPQIRHKKVDNEEIKVICKRIENVIKDKNSSIDTQKAMYEAKYMIRTLWKRKEEGKEDILADDMPFD